MKKLIPRVISSAVVMLVLPWLAVTLLRGDGGMAACFILFFAVDPIFAVLSGIVAGKEMRKLWVLPLITAVLFLAGAWLLFDTGEKAFILYALIYLALGTAAMAITFLIKKRH